MVRPMLRESAPHQMGACHLLAAEGVADGRDDPPLVALVAVAQRWCTFVKIGSSLSTCTRHAIAAMGSRVFVLGRSGSESELIQDNLNMIDIPDTSELCHLPYYDPGTKMSARPRAFNDSSYSRLIPTAERAARHSSPPLAAREPATLLLSLHHFNECWREAVPPSLAWASEQEHC